MAAMTMAARSAAATVGRAEMVVTASKAPTAATAAMAAVMVEGRNGSGSNGDWQERRWQQGQQQGDRQWPQGMAMATTTGNGRWAR